MGKTENLEEQVRALSAEELARFREWFAHFDAEVWDRQLEADVKAGKLDRLAERALRAHAAGPSRRSVGPFSLAPAWVTCPVEDL